jgi:hypothetical protein
MVVDDIVKYFPRPDEAPAVLALFDKDANGDATIEDMEMACVCVSNLPICR